MVKKLDDGVGEIIKALHEKNMLKNTIVIFMSDNGGMTVGDFKNWALNWPMRGTKFTPWEGGSRVTANIWSYNLNNKHHIWNGKMHSVDWLPTLLKAIGEDVPNNIDGIDLWNNILTNAESPRCEIFEIEDYRGFDAMILGKYKLITGDVNKDISEFYDGNLRSIKGDAPSYINSISNCATYKILQKINRPVPLDLTNQRNDLIVDCNGKEFNNCYLGNGENFFIKLNI